MLTDEELNGLKKDISWTLRTSYLPEMDTLFEQAKEANRMRENAISTILKISPESIGMGHVPDPVFALCTMALFWQELAKKLQNQLKESKKQDNPKDL